MTPIDTGARTASGRPLFKTQTPKKKGSKDKAPAAAVAIQLGEHGRYQIKSGLLSGEFVARAFPKPPSNARGMIAEAKGATEEAAIATLHEVIDAREVRRAGERRFSEGAGTSVPSTAEYIEALGQVTLSGPQHAMLTAIALAGDEGLTEERVARAGGYKSYATADRALASAGLLMASYLSLEVAPDSGSARTDGTTLLGVRGEAQGEEDPGNWILHAELRDALRVM